MGQSRTLADLLSKMVGPKNTDTTELKAGYTTLPENKFSDFKTWYNKLKNSSLGLGNTFPQDDYADWRAGLKQFGIDDTRGYHPDTFSAQSVIDWAGQRGVTTTEDDVLKMFQTVGLIPDHLKSAAAIAAEEEEAAAAEEETGTGTETETPSYLTADDLSAWWEGIDKSGFGNQEQSKPKPMDDFMKFMMFMSMMQPQRSGGGSQYGYGGLNPGGVMSSYNPLDNISQLISAFGQLPGSSSSGSSEASSSPTDNNPVANSAVKAGASMLKALV